MRGSLWVLVAIACGLASCGPFRRERPAPAPAPALPPAPAPILEEPNAPEPSPPEPDPTPPVVETPEKPLQATILLSDEAPAYTRVAADLTLLLGEENARTISLEGDVASLSDVVRAAQGSESDNVVAIGLLAALAGRKLEGKKVLFCQVFNHVQHDLVNTAMKGVDMIPPPGRLLEAWHDLDPDVRRVGVITGDNHDALIAEAMTASSRHGMEIVHRVVSSDKEALYEYQRLIPEIEGLWLLPDNRVLSAKILRQIMSLSRKKKIQVLVNHAQLLKLGALISVSGDHANVAELVYRRLQDARDTNTIPGEDLVPLSEVEVAVNPAAARLLGVEVPEQFRQFVQVQ